MLPVLCCMLSWQLVSLQLVMLSHVPSKLFFAAGGRKYSGRNVILPILPAFPSFNTSSGTA